MTASATEHLSASTDNTASSSNIAYTSTDDNTSNNKNLARKIRRRGKTFALIRTTPAITDPRELQTILVTSLRSLFGDCESHSILLEVLACRRPRRRHSDDDDDDTGDDCAKNVDSATTSAMTDGAYEAILECPTISLSYVRAALTFSDVPPYLEGTTYRIDFVRSANSVKGLE